MKEADKKAITEEYARRKKELAEMLLLFDDSTFEVISEALLHIIEHFAPKSEYREDYIFLSGRSFMGSNYKDGSPHHECQFFSHGDMHAFSHDLASHMMKIPDIRQAIFHAIEVFHRMRE